MMTTLKFPVETEDNKIKFGSLFSSSDSSYSIDAMYIDDKLSIKYLLIGCGEGAKAGIVGTQSIEYFDNHLKVEINPDTFFQHSEEIKKGDEEYVSNKAGEDLIGIWGVGNIEGYAGELTAKFLDTEEIFEVKDALLNLKLREIETFILKDSLHISAGMCSLDEGNFVIQVNGSYKLNFAT